VESAAAEDDERVARAAARLKRVADRMQRRSDALTLRAQRGVAVSVGDAVRVALHRLSKAYRRREKSRFKLDAAEDPFRLRSHYSSDLYRVVEIRRLRRDGDVEEAESDGGNPENCRYRVRKLKALGRDDASVVDLANGVEVGGLVRRAFGRADLLWIPQDVVYRGRRRRDRFCECFGAELHCLRDGAFARAPDPSDDVCAAAAAASPTRSAGAPAEEDDSGENDSGENDSGENDSGEDDSAVEAPAAAPRSGRSAPRRSARVRARGSGPQYVPERVVREERRGRGVVYFVKWHGHDELSVETRKWFKQNAHTRRIFGRWRRERGGAGR